MWQPRKRKLRNETIEFRYSLNGMSEMKWKDEGDFWSDSYKFIWTESYRVIYSGDKTNNTRAGIILTKEWGKG